MSSRWATGRIEAFSDGVFAIAITLLVLDIGVPDDALDDLWRGVLEIWPAYLGYATSFLTIGAIWLAHHAVFRRLQYADERIVRLNLLLLMVVAFLPFPTRLVSQAFEDPGAERTAVIFYGLNLLAIHAIFAALWSVAASDRELLRPEVSEKEAASILVAVTPRLGVYAAATAVAILTPRIAAIGYLVIAIGVTLRVSTKEDERPAAASELETRPDGGT